MRYNRLRSALAVAAALILSSCQEDPISWNAPVVTYGSLAISLSSLSFYAKSAKVWMRSYDNGELETYTLEMSGTSGALSCTLPTKDYLRTGTYSIEVWIYNSAGSLNLVAIGYIDNVSIVDSQTASASVDCLPMHYRDISPNERVSPTLASYDERWYYLYVRKGQEYTLEAPGEAVRLVVYEPTGAFVADASVSDFTFTPIEDRYYFIGVASAEAAVTPTILVTAVFNEGSKSAPIPLSLDTPHTFLVGSNDSDYSTSYYSFTTTDSGTYYFVPSETLIHYSSNIYSDPSFSTEVETELNASDEMAMMGLSASTTYYWKINNQTSRLINAEAKLVSPSRMPVANNEGSVGSPVRLTLNEAHSAVFGGHIWDNASYYSFTTGPSVSAIRIDQGELPQGIEHLNYSVGTDASFSRPIEHGPATASGSFTVGLLTSSTTYYLKLSISADQEHRDSQTTLSIIPTAFTPSYTVLQVWEHPSVATNTSGALTSSEPEVWYKAKLANDLGGKYLFRLYDDHNAGGGFTSTAEASVFMESGEAYVRNYGGYRFDRWDESLAVTVPAGDDEVLILIRPQNWVYDLGTFGIRFTYPENGSLIIEVN